MKQNIKDKTGSKLLLTLRAIDEGLAINSKYKGEIKCMTEILHWIKKELKELDLKTRKKLTML